MLVYWRRPFFTNVREPFSADVVKTMAKLLGFSFLMLPIVAIIIGTVFSLTGSDIPDSSQGFEDLQRSSYFFLAAVIMAPLIEEVLFRSWLGSRLGIWVGLPMILFLTTTTMLVVAGPENAKSFGRLVPMALILYGLTLWNRRKAIFGPEDNDGKSITETVFPFLFWGSAIVFGLIHLGNFDIGSVNPIFAIMILPQFIVGLMLSYIRMRFGLLYAIGFHAAYNGVLVSISMLAMQAASGA